jgi:hypothetical protein
VLLVATAVELWASGRADPVAVGVGLAGTAPLVLRRRFPLTVVVVVMGSVGALTLAGSAFIPL